VVGIVDDDVEVRLLRVRRVGHCGGV